MHYGTGNWGKIKDGVVGFWPLTNLILLFRKFHQNRFGIATAGSGVAGQGGPGVRTPLSCPLGSMWNVQIRWDFFVQGGRSGSQIAADDENARTPPEPSNQPTPLTAGDRSRSQTDTHTEKWFHYLSRLSHSMQ